MLLSKIDSLNAIAQFFTVIVLFVLVLGITYVTTKWIANYQKISGKGKNLESIEVHRLTNNKYIQIVRAGNKYLVIAVCKDTVTMLTELEESEVQHMEITETGNLQFKDILEKMKNLKSKD